MADPITPPVAAPVVPATPPEPPAKKYTDDDVNALVAKGKSDAVNALLKEAGIESTGKLKDDLKALREYQDKGKTEAEKAAATAKEATDKLTASEARAMAAELKADALGAGIDPKKIDRAVKIIATYDGKTSADKVAAFLAENPEFKAGTVPGNFGGQTKLQAPDAKAQAAAQINAAFGLKTK